MSCCCAPSCATPSCPQTCCSQSCCSQSCCSPCSYPVGGLGSLSCCSNSCCPSPCCGCGTSARSLGLTSGGNIGCINQIPPSEIVIKPPPVVVTVPGAVLAATCEPLRVGGYTACGTCCPPCGSLCNPC